MAKSLINELKWQMILTITLSTLPPKLMMESPKQGNLLLITWEENLDLLLFSFLPLIQQKLKALQPSSRMVKPLVHIVFHATFLSYLAPIFPLHL